MSRIREGAVAAAAMEIYSAVAARTSDAGALYAWDHFLRGEMKEAADIAMSELRRGHASPEMQKVAARLYHSANEKKGRGRKALMRPPKWMEIGSRFDALHREAKLTWADAVAQLMIEFPRGKTSIEDAVRFFLDVEKRVYELIELKHPLAPR